MDFKWAVTEAKRKKKVNCSLSEFLTIKEGACVQIMHVRAYDSEPETIVKWIITWWEMVIKMICMDSVYIMGFIYLTHERLFWKKENHNPTSY